MPCVQGLQTCCCSLVAILWMGCTCEYKVRKYPESYLKSPGIKQRGSGRGTHPGPLPSMESATLIPRNPRFSEDREPHSPRIHNTPPTPSTPLTPPHSANTTISDNSVFAHVLIQGGNISPGPTSLINPLPPPPLPPRRKREPSIGNTSPKVKQAPDAPLLPPRDNSPPPPLPPRINNTLGGTLPRITASSPRETPGTLPRRNSALEMPTGSIPTPPTVAPRRSSQSSMNGPGLLTPELPPKTYRNIHLNHSNTAPR